jgi:hypothetical protein
MWLPNKSSPVRWASRDGWHYTTHIGAKQLDDGLDAIGIVDELRDTSEGLAYPIPPARIRSVIFGEAISPFRLFIVFISFVSPVGQSLIFCSTAS